MGYSREISHAHTEDVKMLRQMLKTYMDISERLEILLEKAPKHVV